MSIKGILMAGAALCTFSMAQAFAAEAPHFAAVAAHPGQAHVKTVLHAGRAQQLTSTASVYTSVSIASDYKKKTPLEGTYYTFYDSGSFCNSTEKMRVKLATKKTKYATLSTGVETLTGYCSTSPTKFYGDNYDLQTKAAKNKTDTFTSTLVGKKIHYNGGVYNINLNLDVSVSITK